MTYLSVTDMATKMEVKHEWLRAMIRAGHLPSFTFGHTYVLPDTAEMVASIRNLDPRTRATTKSRLPDPVYDPETTTVIGHTVKEIAESMGVSMRAVQAQLPEGTPTFQGQPIISSALRETLTHLLQQRQTNRRIVKETFLLRSKRVRPIRFTPNELLVAEKYADGENFSDIAKQMGVTRERASKLYATWKRKTELLAEKPVDTFPPLPEEPHAK